jgi:large-conductance mechanosensitive channel
VVKPYEVVQAKLAKPTEEAPAAPSSEELLAEIRDLLKSRNA